MLILILALALISRQIQTSSVLESVSRPAESGVLNTLLNAMYKSFSDICLLAVIQE